MTASRVSSLLKRSLIFVHRWLGVGLAAILTVWFLSGMVMMYWSYPSVSTTDRLAHAPRLDPARIQVPPDRAFRPAEGEPSYVALSSFDGRPVYVGGPRMVYADDGSELREVDAAMVDRAAAAWSGLPAGQATRQSVTEVEQWTLGDGLPGALPLEKYSWPDGQQVYVHAPSAQVVQYTTRASRFWTYLGAMPHWLYIPALRTREATWAAVIVWSSLVGVVAAVLGLVIAAWMVSPARRYQYAGSRSRIPYRGWKRWHTIGGLVFGVAAVTWGFSGFLSLEPFRVIDRLTELSVGSETLEEESRSLEVWGRVTDVLRGRRLAFAAYAERPASEAIAAIPDFEVKELEYTSFAGQPIYLATNSRGETRIVPVRGEPQQTFASADLMRRIAAAAGEGAADIQLLDTYDAYYRDRRRALPLPVIRVRMGDALDSRYYVDPKTATVVGSYSTRDWVSRWLYHGLHSFDFPWLINHRPLWDIVVLTLMLGGTALCVTSLVMAWRVLALTVAAAFERPGRPDRNLLLDVER